MLYTDCFEIKEQVLDREQHCGIAERFVGILHHLGIEKSVAVCCVFFLPSSSKQHLTFTTLLETVVSIICVLWAIRRGSFGLKYRGFNFSKNLSWLHIKSKTSKDLETSYKF